MLFIEGSKGSVSAHIGSMKRVLEGSNLGEILLVQADGDELEKILEDFQGIPRSKSSVQKWFGDHAKFIAHNLSDFPRR